jgi:hypothetical protein
MEAQLRDERQPMLYSSSSKGKYCGEPIPYSTGRCRRRSARTSYNGLVKGEVRGFDTYIAPGWRRVFHQGMIKVCTLAGEALSGDPRVRKGKAKVSSCEAI